MAEAAKKDSPAAKGKEAEKPAEGEAAAEGAEGAEGGEAAGGGKAKKLVLFVVLPLLLLIAIGAGLYFTGMLDKMLGKNPDEQSADATAGGEAPKEDAKAEHGKEKGEGKKDEHGKEVGGSGAYFLEIPNMIVNLATDDGQPRYLRLSVQLELESQSDMDAVEAVMPRVVDQFQTYLRELRVKDLRGSQGIYRLQMELLSRVNAAAYPVEVKDVLFQEILIQ
jgi:flagellar FliL protein